ncbi:MAG: squalene/phytoene synthase family protein, partial [Elusimicrobiaceae bacterium]|nr:squalene/phytoene synthase family protein [Elusimicrobiaceae bacterium]
MNKQIKQLLKTISRSFYLSIKFIPKNMQKCFACGYLLCRYADSIADTNIFTNERKSYWLQKFPSLYIYQQKNDIELLLKEIFEANKQSTPEKKLLESFKLSLSFFNTLDEEEKKLVLEVLENVCKGMLLDLEYFDGKKIKALETKKQLDEYCYYIGGMPGVFWTKLIMLKTKAHHNPQIYLQAEKIGKALQVVNILKDIEQDYNLKRCYLSQEDLKVYNLNPEDINKPQNFYKLKQIIDGHILSTANNLKVINEYLSQIPNNFFLKLSIVLPILFAFETLTLIARDFNFGKPLKISKLKVYSAIAFSPLTIPFLNIIIRKKYKTLKN